MRSIPFSSPSLPLSLANHRTLARSQHWLLRLHSILRLHLLEHLFTELTGLFSLLPPSSYPSPSSSSSSEIPLFHPSIPFEFHVLLASLPGLRGDGPRSVESLTDVLRGSKSEMWKCGKEGDLEGERKWRERAERVGGLVVGVLKEIRVSRFFFSVFLVGLDESLIKCLIYCTGRSIRFFPSQLRRTFSLPLESSVSTTSLNRRSRILLYCFFLSCQSRWEGRSSSKESHCVGERRKRGMDGGGEGF